MRVSVCVRTHTSFCEDGYTHCLENGHVSFILFEQLSTAFTLYSLRLVDIASLERARLKVSATFVRTTLDRMKAGFPYVMCPVTCFKQVRFLLKRI